MVENHGMAWLKAKKYHGFRMEKFCFVSRACKTFSWLGAVAWHATLKYATTWHATLKYATTLLKGILRKCLIAKLNEQRLIK